MVKVPGPTIGGPRDWGDNMPLVKELASGQSNVDLPGWARRLADHYYTRTVSTFLLHGAVRDFQPQSSLAYGPLSSFLEEDLFGRRDHVLFYDRSSGIRAAAASTQQDFGKTLKSYDTLHGSDFSKQLPKDPSRALQLLENYIRLRLSEGKSLALVVDFAETLVPAGDPQQMSAEDRFVLTTFSRWTHDPQFLAGDLSIVLIAENAAEVSHRISRNSYVSLIEVPLPNEKERSDYIRFKLRNGDVSSVSDVSEKALAVMSAGLSRVNLDRVLTEAQERGFRVTPERLKERKKELIQSECHGLLELIEPSCGLDSVAGHGAAKNLLSGAATALRQGDSAVLPMGYLISGPIGTGKTYLVTCFAGEVGIPCVKFMNFRSQWQGATEANLEKIFAVLKALSPVAVIVDEADAMLGNRSQTGDSGTSARVFGALASFMGNSEYRGKVVWFLLTARPDLLPVDLKRQGRAEEHLALFYPQTDGERDELFRVLSAKVGLDLPIPSFAELLPEHARSYSGADIEAVLVRTRFRAAAGQRQVPTIEDLKAVLADFVPPSYPLEIELQNLCAVRECTSRELLPEVFKHLDREGLTRRIGELKSLLRAE